MYRYERHFGSFYRNPTILETVSIASKWVNMHLSEIFLNNDILALMCASVKVKMWKSNVKNIFHIVPLRRTSEMGLTASAPLLLWWEFSFYLMFKSF